jgi:hypothetical protein
MVEQDFKKFYESLNNELIALKDRVRSLIGNANWGEDGRYREAILKNMISKFLPKKYSMGTGFVINKDKEITKQIDIIIYDNSSPVLFSEGDFVIVLASTVKAIIEVKSSIRDTTELREYIKVCEENAKKIEAIALYDRMFNGVFCYECELSSETLEHSLKDFFNFSECSIFRKVSNISLGNKKFLHVWLDHKPFSLKGYELPELSFAYFIANLLISLNEHSPEGRDLFSPLESKNPFEKFEIVDNTRKWDRYI